MAEETNNTSDVVKFKDLIKKKESHGWIIANYVKDGKYYTKRDIEKNLAFKYSLRGVDFMKIAIDATHSTSTGTKEEYNKLFLESLIKSSDDIPGDVQRDLRTFYTKYHRYGFQKKGKGKRIEYCWVPIRMSEMDTIFTPAMRNIFNTVEQRNDFIQSNNNTCEMCGANTLGKKNYSGIKDIITICLAIDHWRAYIIYNIDDPGIAVLLCETCNNIHHNYDASKIALTYQSNLKIVKNWIGIEKRIREAGFPPNEEDRQEQENNVRLIIEHHRSINPIRNEFWEGLFTNEFLESLI